MTLSVLVDLTRCTGCKACQTACKQWNDLPAGIPEFDNNLTFPSKTDGNTYTVVQHRVTKKDGQDVMRFAKMQCLHCLEPACVSACFAKALQKTAEGPVVYYPHLCVGCRYCMLACPFNVPKYEWDEVFPLISKCQYCFDPNGRYDRVGRGQKPACVDSCPNDTMIFGNRDEILKEAWNRINGDPKYVKHVYGEKEAGGTNWLYISDVPFETFGFRTGVTERPLPEYTHDYLKWTPTVIAAWGGLLTLMYLYTKRRGEVGKEQGQDKNISA
ncbi:formate dehydrogenase iron-sulfur subunit [Desulfohalotomaculum tongense]|uniref:4Fe-4S dicluster domain-containing protein n=1 Tax=Desulforadius tongensis TaxID=1216062 RepID=UPI00195B02D5|nr:4Fe-4S dicluster domain-containing protein [Desulforadius tongensis]MBM7855346.1 formate dehydrogenase iron-sulfur subunit [Desulforadius tongensis]